MTRKFEFNDYRIVFNGHHFQGEGHLIGLPRSPQDMYGGRVMVASRPPQLSYTWLLQLAQPRAQQPTIYGTIEELDGSTIQLQKGVLTRYAPGPNTSGLYDFTFAFEVIHPPL